MRQVGCVALDQQAIKKYFEYKCSNRLSDILSYARKVGKRLGWIGESSLNSLMRHWSSYKFMEISQKAKKNNASEKGGSLLTGGSISTLEHRRPLVT